MNTFERAAQTLAIFDLRAAGFTVAQIAVALDLSERTVYRAMTKTVSTERLSHVRE